MGLIDVLNGMQHGPRGQTTPPPSSGGGGGMSPITMAILGLIAYKAIKGFTAPHPGASPAPPSSNPLPQGGAPAGGSLADVLKSGLGGLLAGGAAGGALSGGLNDLLKQFEQRGLGGVASSWVGSGPNRAVSPDDLSNALSPDQINTLTAQTGLSREDLLNVLSQHLPAAIDKLTPNGRLPTAEEAARVL
jgi:uncharacterized protein YidB (DUF937 family)